MAPNNYSITGTETTTESEQTSLERHFNSTNAINRKSKNILNSFENLKDENGNYVGTANEPEYKIELAWFNIIGFIYLHASTIYTINVVGLNKTFAFAMLIGLFSGFGITAGAHRLWAHGAYKANLALRVFLVILQSLAFQNSVYEWVRDHRVHHKFTDTNADPHNASRGFFFSHIGWLLCKKHPDVKKFGAKVNMADLEADPVLMFQHKYYLIMMPICCFLIPSVIPWYFWGESFYTAYLVAGVSRWIIVLHITWLINSAAHMFGDKPYDQFIRPVDNLTVAFFAFGEGFHNYHHVFPWDYRTSEFGLYYANFTNAFLDFFASIGWATDLKTVPMAMVEKRALRTGDGSHAVAESKNKNNFLPIPEKPVVRDVEHFWGWNDELLTNEDKEYVMIINQTE